MTYTPRRPAAEESSDYYKIYIQQVNDEDFLAELKTSTALLVDFLNELPSDKWQYRYADDKWSIAEVMLHIIDTERIMAYRALRIARNDKTPLPGFDQDDYIPHCHAEKRSPASIIAEYEAVRKSTILFFEHLNDQQLQMTGTASNSPFTPRALGFIIMGHQNHHLKVLKERYLS